MKVSICAIGRARRGPEVDLWSDYLKRFDGAGRGVALGPAALHELDAKTGGKDAESALLLDRVPAGARIAALDERGDTLSSEQFAKLLADWRDSGAPEACFLIGGADGHTEALRNRADRLISFGRMTWPHMLARVMLTEQLYRAAAILSGHPYHRGG